MATKPESDLDRLSVQELTALIGRAEKMRASKLDQAKAALLAEVEARAAELGLSLSALHPDLGRDEIDTRRPRKAPRNTPAGAKYRGPKGEEWSGRGRPPAWIVSAEASGTPRDKFKI